MSAGWNRGDAWIQFGASYICTPLFSGFRCEQCSCAFAVAFTGDAGASSPCWFAAAGKGCVACQKGVLTWRRSLQAAACSWIGHLQAAAAAPAEMMKRWNRTKESIELSKNGIFTTSSRRLQLGRKNSVCADVWLACCGSR